MKQNCVQMILNFQYENEKHVNIDCRFKQQQRK